MKRVLSVAVSVLMMLFLCSPVMAAQLDIPDGAEGIWWIPNLHIKQPVYHANTWREWQPIVDAKESALIQTWLDARLITDHCNSKGMDGEGRWNMSGIHLGDSAYYITQNGKYKYSCYLTAIVDVGSWGYTINNKILEPASSTDIANRCCVGMDTTRNYFALFRFEKEIR